jgi:hypothetical protein
MNVEIHQKCLEISGSISLNLQSAFRDIGPIPFPNRKERGLAFFLALAVRGLMITLLAVLSACSGDPENPEEQIREMIAAGEEAVETCSIMTTLDYVANNYQDKLGRQKKDIQRLVSGYILRNKPIHLLTRVQNVALSEDKTQADVILYVGMAGVPVTSVDQLLLVRADLYRFDLSVKLEDGDWRVASGSWQQAQLPDF